MLSGINQSGMFSNVSFSRYWQQIASSSQTQSANKTNGAESTEKESSQQNSVRDAFAKALKESGMSEEKIAALPEKVWEKAEKKAGDNEKYNFAEDKQLQKLVDFLARKAELVKSEQNDDDSSSDSANISQEAKDAAASATNSETEEEANSSNSLSSILDEFKDKLNEILMSGLGLGSTNANSTSMMSISASFEISYSSMIAVAGENGMTMQETSFSLKGSFEFMGMSSNGSSINPFDFFSGKNSNAEDTDETNASDPFAQFMDYFSPEKTADRILDFSLGFFGNSQQYKEGGNTEDSRQSFADIIGAAIQKGFDQALGTLGKLPDKTQEEVDDTHTRVFDGLDNFIKTGSKDGKEAKEPSFDFAAYSSVFEMNYSSTTSYYSAAETEDALENLYNKYFNKGYGTQVKTEEEDKQVPIEDEEAKKTKQINLTA